MRMMTAVKMIILKSQRIFKASKIFKFIKILLIPRKKYAKIPLIIVIKFKMPLLRIGLIIDLLYS